MHYFAVVIGVDEQQLPAAMEPFNHCTENPAYLKFEDIEEKYRVRYETDCAQKIRLSDGTLKWPWDESFKEGPSFDDKRVYPPDSTQVKIPYKELYPDFDTFMEEHADEQRDEATGRYGSWSNPKSVWDWYVVGGRWTGFFKTKPGAPHRYVPNPYEKPPAVGTSDLVCFGDWDFAGQMDLAEERAVKKYNRVFEILDGRPLPPLWEDVLKSHNGNRIAAGEASAAHPTNLFLRKLWENKRMREEPVFEAFVELAEEYGRPLEQYIVLSRLRSTSAYAIIKDGVLIRRRLRTNPFEEVPELEWCRKVHSIYSELSPDTELIAVDYHS